MLVVGVRSCGRDMDKGGGKERDSERLGFFQIWVLKESRTYGKFFVWISVSSGEGG